MEITDESIERYFAGLRKSNKVYRRVTYGKTIRRFRVVHDAFAATIVLDYLNRWRKKCHEVFVNTRVHEKWMYDNINGLWNETKPYPSMYRYVFEKESDAILFKLRWS